MQCASAIMRAHTMTMQSLATPRLPSRASMGRVLGCAQATPRALPSHSQPTPNPSLTEQGIDVGGMARVSVVAAVALSIVATPRAAHAEERVWKPRRHHRRMGETIADDWASQAVEAEDRVRVETQQQRLQAKRQRKLQEEEEFQRMKKEQEMRMQKAEKILSHVEASRSQPIAIRVGGVDLLPYLVWSPLVLFGVWALRSYLQTQEDNKRTGGKWVYDRSLGGKKVWVPDSSTSTEGGALRVKTQEFERLASVAAAARQKLDAVNKELGLPAWWNLPPTSFASPEVKAAKQAEADRLLLRLEAAKNRGEDYSLRDILQLRAVCQEGGVSVRPKTVGGRDAIYQTAVDAAITFAQDRSNTNNSIGDQDCEHPEARLLTGLAGDLNLPEERATAIVRQAVAAACRARLLDAVKYLKESNEMDALVALMHLSSLLMYLPALAEGTAEPELIASSLQSTSNIEERQKLFYILGQLQVENATLFAEMLGFDAALVVPKLWADMDAYRQQQEAAAQ